MFPLNCARCLSKVIILSLKWSQSGKSYYRNTYRQWKVNDNDQEENGQSMDIPKIQNGVQGVRQ